jgi:hypothetical protein
MLLYCCFTAALLLLYCCFSQLPDLWPHRQKLLIQECEASAQLWQLLETAVKLQVKQQ